MRRREVAVVVGTSRWHVQRAGLRKRLLQLLFMRFPPFAQFCWRMRPFRSLHSRSRRRNRRRAVSFLWLRKMLEFDTKIRAEEEEMDVSAANRAESCNMLAGRSLLLHIGTDKNKVASSLMTPAFSNDPRLSQSLKCKNFLFPPTLVRFERRPQLVEERNDVLLES